MLEPAFNKAFGIKSLCCDDAAGCLTKAGTNDRNETWQACYGAGSYLWLQGDTDKGKCLTNLHWTQDDSCISNKGSECEAWGPESKMLNAKVSYKMGDKKISSEASLAMQDALQHMVNLKIYAGPGAGLRVAYTGPTDARSGPLNLGMMTYRFGGDEQC